MNSLKQRGGDGGSTSIRNPRTFRNITYTPYPVHQSKFLVGQRNTNFGVSNMMNGRRPISFTIQNDVNKIIDHRNFEQFAKIGIEEPFFPDITVSNAQAGGNIFKDVGEVVTKAGKTIAKGAKAVGKFVKDEKLISRGLSATGEFIDEFATPIGTVVGSATGALLGTSVGPAGTAAGTVLGAAAGKELAKGTSSIFGSLGRKAKQAGFGSGDSRRGHCKRGRVQTGGAKRFSFDEAVEFANKSGRRKARVLRSQVFDPLHPGNLPKAQLGDLA